MGFSFKIAECFADFLHNFAKFTRILLNFVKFRPIFSGFSQKLNAAIFTFSIFQRCKFESSRYGVSSTIQLISKFKFDPILFCNSVEQRTRWLKNILPGRLQGLLDNVFFIIPSECSKQ